MLFPIGDQWNDSVGSDYLWSAGNVGEAIPDVMSPATWSAFQRLATEAVGPRVVAGHPLWGTIGGRFYFNVSVALSLAARFRSTAVIGELTEQSIGSLPPDDDIPLVKLPLRRALRDAGLREVAVGVGAVARRRRLRAQADGMAARCERAARQIAAAPSTTELARCWREVIEPLSSASCRMMRYARPEAMRQALYHRALRRLVGDDHANDITTGTHSEGHLASLDLLLGLEDLRAGIIDRQTFTNRFGHRHPHEYELSMARPAEDAEWIDRQLALLEHRSARDLLAAREQVRREAWAAIDGRSRGSAAVVRRLARGWAGAARRRELLRSESTRGHAVLRDFLQRAGELTDLGQDIYLLTLDETARVLNHDNEPLARVEARRSSYDFYRSLPRYPTIIRGPFDPVAWANGCCDHHQQDRVGMRSVITGQGGAAGIVTGRARVVLDLDHADGLTADEILVTPLTNVGWTPLLLQAAAVVTDIGASLSHAAIVARELGIPAVVGCGDATRTITTGDLIRVDGTRGTVERLDPAP